MHFLEKTWEPGSPIALGCKVEAWRFNWVNIISFSTPVIVVCLRGPRVKLMEINRKCHTHNLALRLTSCLVRHKMHENAGKCQSFYGSTLLLPVHRRRWFSLLEGCSAFQNKHGLRLLGIDWDSPKPYAVYMDSGVLLFFAIYNLKAEANNVDRLSPTLPGAPL